MSPLANGTKRYNYGIVICIFLVSDFNPNPSSLVTNNEQGCVYVYNIVIVFLGPEYLQRSFDIKYDEDVAAVNGAETIEHAVHRREAMGMGMTQEDYDDYNAVEKERATHH